MNKKIRWITETAVMLALLVSLQALTKPMGQLVTGVESRCIDDDTRTDAMEFHSFTHRVSGGARDITNEGRILAGQGIDKR